MNNIGKKIIDIRVIYAAISVLTLIVVIAGSTYAFFLASISSDDDIKGSTFDFDVTLKVNRVSKGDKNLVPIYDGTVASHPSQLDTAASEENDCVDKNGRTVCYIYAIEITNNSDDDVTVDTNLSLSGPTNIKWASMSNRTTVGDTHISSYESIDDDATLGSGKNKMIYIMVYLNNTGNNQLDVDGNKSFSGVVSVVSSSGEYIQAQF